MNFEKQTLLPNLSSTAPIRLVEKRKKCPYGHFFAKLVALVLVYFSVSYLINAGDFDRKVVAKVDWEKHSAVGLSVFNDKYHIVWASTMDHANNQFSAIFARLEQKDGLTDMEKQENVDIARKLLEGKDSFSSSVLERAGVSTPISVIYNNGDLYGIYPKNGKPACRHYKKAINFPPFDPLERATYVGLEYAHSRTLAEKWTMNHGTFTGEYFTEPFTGKPLAGHYKGTVEKGGKKMEIEAFHHFLRFSSGIVMREYLSVPEHVKEICVDVGVEAFEIGGFAEEIPFLGEFLKHIL